jgi:hypothetical protein
MQTKYELNQKVYYKLVHRSHVIVPCPQCQGKGGFIVDGNIKFCDYCNRGEVESYIDRLYSRSFVIGKIVIKEGGIRYYEFDDDDGDSFMERQLFETEEAALGESNVK